MTTPTRRFLVYCALSLNVAIAASDGQIWNHKSTGLGLVAVRQVHDGGSCKFQAHTYNTPSSWTTAETAFGPCIEENTMQLSFDGTKLFGRRQNTENWTFRVFLQESLSRPGIEHHFLPHQRWYDLFDNKLRALKDMVGYPDNSRPIATLDLASIGSNAADVTCIAPAFRWIDSSRADSQVLIASKSGQLRIWNPDTGETRSYTLPSGFRADRCAAGSTWDDFYVAGKSSTQYDLRALRLRSGLTTPIPVSNKGTLWRTILEPVLESNSEPSLPGGLESTKWVSPFFVHPNWLLYAPALLLASDERTGPASLDIWKHLPKCSAQPQATLRGRGPSWLSVCLPEYDGLKTSIKEANATVYYRVRSFPGVWLYEYWIYYPFDEGGATAHIHDPEHVFVEVRKFAGTIESISASAHTPQIPNNVFTANGTDVANGAARPALPVRVFVERGKHGSAPDVNSDFSLTPGIDLNFETETARLWGIRDTLGSPDTQFAAYSNVYMSRREWRFAQVPSCSNWGLMHEATLTRQGTPCDKTAAQFRLEPLPADASQTPNSPQSTGLESMRHHDDAKDPNKIRRPWVFPHYAIRAAFGKSAFNSVPEASGGIAFDLFRLSSKLGAANKVPLSGTLVAEAGLMRGTTSAQPPGSPSKSYMWAGARYERSVSSMFGWFLAGHRYLRGEPQGVPFGRNRWSGGAFFKYASSKATLIVHVGPSIGSKSLNGIRMDYRIAVEFRARKGRRGFGL